MDAIQGSQAESIISSVGHGAEAPLPASSRYLPWVSPAVNGLPGTGQAGFQQHPSW